MNGLSGPCCFLLPLSFMHGTPMRETEDKLTFVYLLAAIGSLGFSWLTLNCPVNPKV